MRVQPPLMDALDGWISKQEPPFPSRPEAIRRLVEIGLSVDRPQAQTSVRKAAKAKRMAGEAIDDLTDKKASTADQAHRKRTLLSGPEEFRDVRVDRKKR